VQGVAHRAVPARLRPWLALAATAAVCAAILLGGDRVAHALRYERNALLDGQLWRALTGHLVHLDWLHLAADLTTGALVVAAYGRDLRPAAVLLCALGTSAGLFLFSLRVRFHAGLSGVLMGMVVFGALAAWRRGSRRAWLPVLPLAGVVFVAQAWTLVPLSDLTDPGSTEAALLYGAISGALAFAILYRPSRSRL